MSRLLSDESKLFLIDESRRQLKQINELSSHLVTSEGELRPGVSQEQYEEFKSAVKKFTGVQKKYAKEFKNISEEQRELNEYVDELRGKMRAAEKRFKVKFPELLRKTYRL
jgi:DNA-binding protein H-NS